MNVLFVCVANSGRSVLAERLFARAAAGRHQARSAGSAPGAAAHPQVVAALAEVGIDASDHVPRLLLRTQARSKEAERIHASQ